MFNLLFSPKGRINPSDFMRCVIILTVVMSVLTLIPMFAPAAAMITGLISFLLIWCWLALCIKRFHDSGKTGWFAPVVIIAFFVLSMVLNGFVMKTFGGDLNIQLQDEMMKLMETEGMSAAFKAGSTETGLALTKATMLPMLIAGIALSLFIGFLVNKLNPHDPEENQYGPAN